MKNRHLFLAVIAAGILAIMPVVALAQTPPVREPVIGINDELEIRVWNQLMEERPDFSPGQVLVRSDGKIPMAIPQLDDVQAAGLKVSSLKKKLESAEVIGKFIVSPQIKVLIAKPSERIQITLTGATSRTIEIARGATLGIILSSLNKIIPKLQEFGLNAETAFVRSAEGEEFPANPALKLEWGDEITSKSQPSPKPNTLQLPPSIQFTPEEIQQYFAQFPEVKTTLEPLLAASEDGKTVSIDLKKITEKERQALGKDAFDALITHVTAVETPPFTDVILAGINVDLTSADNLEAFFFRPNPNPEEKPQVERFKKGDVIVKKSPPEENVVLQDIQDDTQQVILQQGNEMHPLPLNGEKFIEVGLAGIFEQGNKKRALFTNLKRATTKKPLKRMFQEKDELDENITIAEIGDTWVLLKKGTTSPQWQLVLLRDALNRVAPPPNSPPSSQEQGQPSEPTGANTTVAPGIAALPEPLKQSLQAIDAFSKIFLATPIF